MTRITVSLEMLLKAIPRAIKIHASRNSGGTIEHILRGMVCEEAFNALYPGRIKLSNDTDWKVDAKFLERHDIELKSFLIQSRYLVNGVINREGLERIENFSLIVNKGCDHEGIEDNGAKCHYCNPSFNLIVVAGISEDWKFVYLYGVLSKQDYMSKRRRMMKGELLGSLPLRRENWVISHRDLDPFETFLSNVIDQGINRDRARLEMLREAI